MGWLGMHPEHLLEANALEAGEPLLLPAAAGQPLRPLHLSTELWPVRGGCHRPVKVSTATSFSVGSCNGDIGEKCSEEEKCPSWLEGVKCVDGRCVCEKSSEKPCAVNGKCVPLDCQTQAIQAAAMHSAGGVSAKGTAQALAAGEKLEQENIVLAAKEGTSMKSDLGLEVPMGKLPRHIVPALLHPGRGEANRIANRHFVVTLPDGGIAPNAPTIVEDGQSPKGKEALAALINQLEEISRKLREAGSSPVDELPSVPGTDAVAVPEAGAAVDPTAAGAVAVPEAGADVDPTAVAPADVDPTATAPAEPATGEMPEAALWAASFSPARPIFKLTAGRTSRSAAARWSSFFPYVSLAAGSASAAPQRN